jgi:hypothetical protein
MCKKKILAVSAAIMMTIAMVMFFPVTGTAGSLEPSATPAPTMKTLDQIPPTWSQKIPGAQRFELVLDGAAVLDKETGLVWEQSPSTISMTWSSATETCANKEVGGRKGWLLPSINQLESLVETSVSETPKLPVGHPFVDVQSSNYWSATTWADGAAGAWVVAFSNASTYNNFAKIANLHVWCVRSGQSPDTY